MQNPSFVGGLVVAIAVVGLTSACNNEPKPIVGPGETPTGSTSPPFIVSVAINGPSSIPPGQSAQFTATSTLSDGTTQTATNVRWSSHYRLFQVNASGLVTAGDRIGEDTLTAEVSSPNGVARSIKELLILPDGTYRVVGMVTENVPPATPVVGARVEVTNGTQVSATTDWDGRYKLYGVPGTADIRVTRDGYQPHVQRFQIAEHVTQNFQLALSGTRLDLAGLYTLTIDAACSTSTPVPVDLRRPSYAAFLTQSGSMLEVILTESSRFRVNRIGRGDRFSGRVDAAGATFNLGDNFYQYYAGPYDPSTYPNVVEGLSDGTFLVVDGTAITMATPVGLSGNLQGFLINHDSNFPGFPQRTLGTCYSSTHRFTLTRR
jgi:hypothetical protein